MTKNSPAQAELDALLDRKPKARPAAKKRCLVCDNEKLAEMIALYLTMKREKHDRAHLPLSVFYRDTLRAECEGPSERTMRDHVLTCLGLDIVTGESRG